MTDAQALRRDPSVILRKAMTHLRKRWDGHRGMNGRANMLMLKQAVARVKQSELARLADTVRRYRVTRARITLRTVRPASRCAQDLDSVR